MALERGFRHAAGMSRPPRAEEPGATYHVTIHSVDRGVIVKDDRDRAKLVETMAHVVRRQTWICLAYCVMDTHYHLLVTTAEANLASGMRLLNSGFAQTFNRRHRRRGHLFRERYESGRINGDAHLLSAVRYIARNPVDAGMVDDPCAYPWSSYPGVAGTTTCRPFVDRAAVLEHVGAGPEALRMLREFVEGDLGTTERAA
jgi:putative transposase